MADKYYINNSCEIYANSLVNSLNTFVSESYFSKDAFEKSLPLWENVPLVFSSIGHPDPFLFNSNREAALRAVDGRIIGRGLNPRIEDNKLMLNLQICDQGALALQREGALSLSSGFIALRDSNKHLQHIESVNHILLFRKDENNKPKDRSVLINQLGVKDMSKTIIYVNDANEKRRWDSILNTEIARGEMEVKISVDDFPSNETLARAGYMSYHEAGLLEDETITQANAYTQKEEPLTGDGLNFDVVTKRWY